MYLEHFRLRELPFTLTPDTAFFMNRAGHQDALNVLLVALRSGEGFVKVTGEVGTGKTVLCRSLMKTVHGEAAVAYVPNPYLRPTTLLYAIADELGIKYPARAKLHQFMAAVYRGLILLNHERKRVVVCLDEVQAMPIKTLETLRLLTNLETEKRKLIQVVLFGQPELDALLDEPSIRQLRQRITFSYRLQPLNRVAHAQYVNHRLAIAGHQGPPLFSVAALNLLYRHSRGIPRLVNILAHKGLMAAFGEGEAAVARRHVRAAADDTADARAWRGPARPLRALTELLGLMRIRGARAGH